MAITHVQLSAGHSNTHPPTYAATRVCVCVCYSHRMPTPAPCVSFSGEHKGLQVHVIWNGQDKEHGVDLIGTGGQASTGTGVQQLVWRHTTPCWSHAIHYVLNQGVDVLHVRPHPCHPCADTVPASLATYLACQAFNPDLIISAGTAGGFKARVRKNTQLAGWQAGWPTALLCRVCLMLSQDDA